MFFNRERPAGTVEMIGLPLPGDGTEAIDQENNTDRSDRSKNKKSS